MGWRIALQGHDLTGGLVMAAPDSSAAAAEHTHEYGPALSPTYKDRPLKIKHTTQGTDATADFMTT